MLTPTRRAAARAERPAHAYSIAVYAAAAAIALIAAEFRYVAFDLMGFASSRPEVAALGIASFLFFYGGLGLVLASDRRLPVWKALVFGVAATFLYLVVTGLLLALTNALARPSGGLSARAFSVCVTGAVFVIILGVALLLGARPRRQSWLSLAILAVAALTFHILFRLADNLIAPDALGGAPAVLQRILPPAVNDLIVAVFCLKLFERMPRRANLPADAAAKGASELITAWPPKAKPAAPPRTSEPGAARAAEK